MDDISTFPDLDPNFTEISGTRAVAEVLARGLMMPHSRLIEINDEPRAGRDLRRHLSKRYDARTPFLIRQDVAAEAKLDERVLSVETTVDGSEVLTTGKLRVRILGQTADGPFELEVSVSALNLELLKVA